jgi:hypothetical protein
MFLRVLAELVGEHLLPIKEPKTEFPTNGDVRVYRDQAPADFRFHDIGIWKVREVPPPTGKKEKYAKYSAIERLSDMPAEFITIQISPEAIDDLRNRLLEEGISCHYRLDTHPVLVECIDGTVIGPFRLDRHADGRRYRVASTMLDKPVKAWRTKAPFRPLNLQDGGSRTFASIFTSPPPETLVDLLPLRQVLSQMLRLSCRTSPGNYLLNEKQRDEIVERLIATPTDHLSERRERLKQALDASLSTGKDLEAWSELLMNHPNAAKQLAEQKEHIAKQVRDELESTSNETVKQLNAAREKIRDEEARLLELQQKSKAEETKSESIVRQFEELTAVRIREAEQNVIRTLADVAVLKPFLQAATKPPVIQTENGPQLVESSTNETATKSLNSIQQCIELVTDNLKALGVIPGNAKPFANEIVTALALGQWVLFQGSLSSVVARTVTRSLFCAHTTAVAIPVGFVDQRQIDEILSKNANSSSPNAIVIEGVNRSCCTAYGMSIQHILIDNAFRASEHARTTFLLGTIVAGASSLPLDDSIASFGPVFNTDLLTWQHAKTKPIIPGQFLSQPLLDHVPSTKNPELLENVFQRLDRYPNALWKRQAKAAFGLLNELMPDGAPSPYDSLLFGWILPRMNALSLPIGEQWNESESEFAGEEVHDSRVRAYIDLMSRPE